MNRNWRQSYKQLFFVAIVLKVKTIATGALEFRELS
jgi:hypothetical protein